MNSVQALGRFRWRLAFVLLIGWVSQVGWAAAGEPWTTTLEKIKITVAQRYGIRNYALEPKGLKPEIVINTPAGLRLRYQTNGGLLEKAWPDGRTIAYEQGFPTTLHSGPAAGSESTQYRWGVAGPLASVTQQGSTRIEREYNASGEGVLEIVHEPGGWMRFRRQFSYHPAQRIFAYAETETQHGETRWVVMNPVTGMLQQQWRLHAGWERDWTPEYQFFLGRLEQHWQQRLQDVPYQRRDSFNRTRKDFFIEAMAHGRFYPLAQFVADVQAGRIQFSDDWQQVDCFAIPLALPQLELVSVSRVLAPEVRLKGESLYIWHETKKRWERHLFNPETERLVPTAIHGLARLETIAERTAWKKKPGAGHVTLFSGRLLTDEATRQALSARLARPMYLAADEDDLVLAAQEIPPRPRPAQPAQPLAPELRQQFLRELSARIQQELLTRPAYDRRDAQQCRQGEAMLEALALAGDLPAEAIFLQWGRVTESAHPLGKALQVRGVTVKVPGVRMKKKLRVYAPVQRRRGLLEIWETDDELPEGGFWKPYVERPGRDRLVEVNGRLELHVDQGEFTWVPSGATEPLTITGTLFLFHPAAPSAAGAQARSQDKVQEEGAAARISAKAASKVVHCKWLALKNFFLNRQTQPLQASPGTTGTVTVYRNWRGRPSRYYVQRRRGEESQSEVYDRQGRLRRLTDRQGRVWRITHRGQDEIRVEAEASGKKTRLRFLGGVLHAVDFSDGSHLRVAAQPGQTQLAWVDAAGKVTASRVYPTAALAWPGAALKKAQSFSGAQLPEWTSWFALLRLSPTDPSRQFPAQCHLPLVNFSKKSLLDRESE